MIKKPQFDTTISLGTLLTLGTILTTVAIAWGQISERLDSDRNLTAQNWAYIKEELTQFDDESEKIKTRLRHLEEQVARTDERFTLILSMISEMKAQMTALTANQAKK